MQVSFARVFCQFCDKESMSFFHLGSQSPTFERQVHHWLPESFLLGALVQTPPWTILQSPFNAINLSKPQLMEVRAFGE